MKREPSATASTSDEPRVRPPRDPREPPRGSPAYVYPEQLMERRAWLDRLRAHHVDLTMRFLEAADGALYTIDMFLAACMSRSYSTVDGFLDAFDNWNVVVAAPLVRVQLDTLVRVSYLCRAPRADDVAEYVLKGGEFRRLKDAHSKRLTDARLGELAEPHHPWIPAVYRATSGWVHLSYAHLYATWQLTASEEPGTPGSLAGATPIRPEQIPHTALEELIGAMTRATEEFFGYMEVWEAREGLPLGKIRDTPKRHE
jgi:hypothetical protein